MGGGSEWNPGNAAPIQFADLGYDIYLGNNRGREYSFGHTQLTSPAEDPELYWDFSWHEMAFDVMANAKAMTENAAGNFSKGWYVGYSQGTI